MANWKGRVFSESLTVSKELCYSKHKQALLTPLEKAVPAGRQARDISFN